MVVCNFARYRSIFTGSSSTTIFREMSRTFVKSNTRSPIQGQAPVSRKFRTEEYRDSWRPSRCEQYFLLPCDGVFNSAVYFREAIVGSAAWFLCARRYATIFSSLSNSTPTCRQHAFFFALWHHRPKVTRGRSLVRGDEEHVIRFAVHCRRLVWIDFA